MVTKGKTKQGQGSTKAAAKGATTKELLTHRIANKKPHLKKQPFVIHSFALVADNEETLADVRQTATDVIGWPISGSAVVRALLRYVGQQPSFWIAKQIHPLLEQEIEAGRVWGTQSKKGKP
jgi:hypothetical protein